MATSYGEEPNSVSCLLGSAPRRPSIPKIPSTGRLRSPSTGRLRSPSMRRIRDTQRWTRSHALVGDMSAVDKIKALTLVRMLQDYGFESIENLDQFGKLLESRAPAKQVAGSDKQHVAGSDKPQVAGSDKPHVADQPSELSSSFLSKSGKSMAYSDSLEKKTAGSDVEPSDFRAVVCPKPVTTALSMDGSWKIFWASLETGKVASWLQRLCIANGYVRDGTGVWKALNIVDGVPLLDGGELHLDDQGYLRRYGKKGDTVVYFSREEPHTPSRAQSPKSPLSRRIQREVCL